MRVTHHSSPPPAATLQGIIRREMKGWTPMTYHYHTLSEHWLITEGGLCRRRPEECEICWDKPGNWLSLWPLCGNRETAQNTLVLVLVSYATYSHPLLQVVSISISTDFLLTARMVLASSFVILEVCGAICGILYQLWPEKKKVGSATVEMMRSNASQSSPWKTQWLFQNILIKKKTLAHISFFTVYFFFLK